MIRKLWVVLLLTLVPALAWSQAAPQTSAAQPKPSFNFPKKPSLPESDQVTNIPYFTLRDGMASKLFLNNTTQNPQTVTVTIFNDEGRSQQLDPIKLAADTIKEINLADVIPSGLFDEGNIEVSYHSSSMAVTCQVTVSNVAKRVSFESREEDMMDFASSHLAGILQLPDLQADGFLAITNTAANRVQVELTTGSKKESLRLFPRETRVVKLTNGADHKSSGTLVRLAHDGKPGDIVTTGFVLNLKTGYSSAFMMVDPAMMRSNQLAGAHFWSGRPDSSQGFPAGTQFHSPLLLANVCTKPVNAHVWVDFATKPQDQAPQRAGVAGLRITDKVTNIDLRDVVIKPGEVQQVELSDALAGVGGHVRDAGFSVTYEGAPGTIIGKLTSVDQSGDFAFEVPIKDPVEMNGLVGGNYPWSLDNGFNTVLHLKNTSAKRKKAIVELHFPSGATYSPEIFDLEPHETIAVDIQHLKDANEPDVHKNKFPAGETHGQLIWLEVDADHSLIGRAEQVNATTGIASSFSCPQYCPPCDGSPSDFFMDPDDGEWLVSDSSGTQLTTFKYYVYMCYTPYGPYSAGADAYGWTSDNPNDVSVDAWGNIYATNGGEANITAYWDYYVPGEDGYGGCTSYPATGSASAYVFLGFGWHRTNFVFDTETPTSPYTFSCGWAEECPNGEQNNFCGQAYLIMNNQTTCNNFAYEERLGYISSTGEHRCYKYGFAHQNNVAVTCY